MSAAELSLEQLLSMANVKMRAGLVDEGIAAFERAIAVAPLRAQTHLSLGEAFHTCARLDQAIACYRRAIELQPGLLQAYLNLSVALRETKRFDQAIDILRRVLALVPAHYEVWNDLGILLQTQRQFDEAIMAHQRAVAIQPRWATGWLNLGNVFYKQRRYDDAIHAFRQAIAFQPDFHEAWCNLANGLRASGRLDEAMEASTRSLQIKPDSPMSLDVRANIFLNKGEIENVVSIFRRTLALDSSDASRHYNLGMTLLLKGEFEEGWRECEWRLRVDPHIIRRPKFIKPAWDGQSDISGKRLLLYTEQGIGDAVQFLRYLTRIPQLKTTAMLQTPPELARLARRCDGIDKVDALTSDAEPANYDLHYPLLSLPFYFGTTLQTIPQAGATVPYLHADPEKVRLWNERMKDLPHPRIGLVWAGSPGHLSDHKRSISLSMLAPLAEFAHATFISLQKGPPAEQTKSPPPNLSIVDFTAELHDFTDTIDLIGALDLVISVDTAVAHLAGAMGKPVWVLLPFVPDWRWMLNRSDSPWYPTMQLFRQPALGDWQAPIQQIVQALRAFKPAK